MSSIHKFHPFSTLNEPHTNFFKQHTSCSCNHYLNLQKGRELAGQVTTEILDVVHHPRLKYPQDIWDLTYLKVQAKQETKETSTGCEVCHLNLGTGTISFWQAHPHTFLHFPFYLNSEAAPSSKKLWPFFQPFKGIFFRLLWPKTGKSNLFGDKCPYCR